MQPNMTVSSNDGFIPDNSPSSDGFVPDQQPQGSYWGDVGKNAVEGLKEIPAGIGSIFDTVTKAAGATSPVEAGKSIFQMARGTPASETSTGQDVQGLVQLAKGIPQGLYQQGKDVASAAVMPAQMMMGTPASETFAGQNLRERPLSSTANILTAPLAFKGAKSMFGRKTGPVPDATPEVPPSGPTGTPNPLQSMGSANLNSMAGIKGPTLARMTPMTENPGDTGINLQKQMQADGVTGANAVEIKPKFTAALNKWGQAVKKAWDDIKKTNAQTSQGTPYHDKLQVNSAPTLKGILDEANEMINSGYDPETGAKMKSMYQNLQNAANGNDGLLSIDHVDTEMGRVGKMFKNAARDSDKFAQASTLWGKLADIREQMVNDVADASGRPDLAQNLKTANRNFSMYKRLEHDIHAEASNIATGQQSMGSILGALKDRVLQGPEVNKAVMKVGETFRGKPIKKVTEIK